VLFERKANEFCRIYSLSTEIKKNKKKNKKQNKNASAFLKIDFTVGVYRLADHVTKECKHIVYFGRVARGVMEIWRKRRNFLADMARSYHLCDDFLSVKFSAIFFDIRTVVSKTLYNS